MKSIDLLLIGAGKMASNYVDVLRAQSINFEIVCRNKNTAENFKKSNNIQPFYGGIDSYIQNSKFLPILSFLDSIGFFIGHLILTVGSLQCKVVSLSLCLYSEHL